MYCQKCGKEIQKDAAFCVECGTPQNVNQIEVEKHIQDGESAKTNNPVIKEVQYNTMCIVGLVVSAISWFLDFLGLVGIAGVVLSVLGLIQCKERHENGKILAILGIIIGGIEIFCMVIYLNM